MNFQTQSSRDCLDLPGASRKVQRTEEIGQNLFWHHRFNNYTKNKIQKKGKQHQSSVFKLQKLAISIWVDSAGFDGGEKSRAQNKFQH